MATLITWICIFPAFASASCQDIRFSDWNHFCFDIKKVNSTTFEAQVSSKSVSTSLSCVLTLPNDKSITLSNCEWRFTYDGNDYWKINLRAEARTTYYFVANYDFWNWSFEWNYSTRSSYYSSSYSDYYPEFTSVTDSRPWLDRWIDVTLKVKRSWSSYNYNWRVDFYVEKYSWGSWSRASSYQYDLDRSSYSFSSSDYWEVRLYNFIKFREEWEYRLVAELRDNNAATHQSFYVGNYYDNSSYSSSSSYNAKELFIYSISSSNPSTNQWIDVTLRAVASNWSIASNYNKKIKIEVQEYRNGWWYSASSSDYDLDRTTYTFSTSDNWSKTFYSLVKFRYSWEYRLKFSEYNDNSIYAVRTINVGSSSSSSSYNSSYNARELSVYSVSSSNPSTNQWVNVTLRALTSNWSIARNYNKKIKIEVQEYRNGSWYSASSSDYDLDRTTYTFSTSDNWSKTFNSLVRFRYSGEYRLKFTEYNDSSVYWTRTFNVGYGSSSSSSYSSSSSARELSVYSVSSSNPSTNQWVDVTVRALTSNWSIARNYNRKVRIEVQEYRNWAWRSANSSDYDLDRTTYTFSTSDNWSKTFYSLVKFRYSWEYRLKFSEYNDSSVYWTRTFNVGSRSSYYYDYYDSYDSYYYDSYYDRYNSSYYSYYSNDNFTDSELRKIRAIYDIWDQVISSLERDYPMLKNSSSWKNKSNNFCRNMKEVLTDKRSASFKSWNDFYRWFTDWLSYTTTTR